MEKTAFLQDLFNRLSEFRLRSSTIPDTHKDWIVSQDEVDALFLVTEAVEDCIDNGMATSKMLDELNGRKTARTGE